jgi:hypothetical protein
MAKKNKSGLGLNMLIAKSHQVSAQVVGVQLSVANLLAIAVSAASVVAGTITITMQKYPGNWELAAVAGIIGIGLAILIEGMTLGALIRIRLASRKIREVDASIESARDEIDWSALEKKQARVKERELKMKRLRATKSFRKTRFWSCPIVLVGSCASAAAGGMFYHTVLAGLGNWQSIAVAALFPFVVTCTFVSSELFKEIQEEAIKEGYSGGGLADAALREETRRLSFQAVHDGILHHFNDAEIQQELKAGTMVMLKDIIVDLRESVSPITIVEGTTEAPSETFLGNDLGNTLDSYSDTAFESTNETISFPEAPDEMECTPLNVVAFKQVSGEGFRKQERNTDSLISITRRRSSGNAKSVEKHVYRILRRKPETGPSEIAKIVGISKGHASRLKTKFLSGQEA